MCFSQLTKHIGLFSICILFFFAGNTFGADTAEKDNAAAAVPSHYFTATYFHTTYRCPTCRQIEALSKEAITMNFSDELKSGDLIWRIVNVEEPENKHYNADYQLFTKSLIISEVKNGKEIRWKNLQKVWHYVRDDEAFINYVTSEIKTWMAP